MAYPDRYFEFTPTAVAGTDNVAEALSAFRKNDMFALAGMAYGGEMPERYYGPPAVAGPWSRRVYYNVEGFDHTYNGADPDLEFDRIVMRAANFALAWNFRWAWAGTPANRVVLLYSHWYVLPFPAEGFRYLGRLYYNHVVNVLSAVEWSAAADPSPPPTLAYLPSLP